MSDERILLNELLKYCTAMLDLLEVVVKSSRDVVTRVQATLDKEDEKDEGTA